MNKKEYLQRVMDIRVALNKLSDDTGGNYDNRRENIEELLNIILFADTTRRSLKDIKTSYTKHLYIKPWH